MTVFPSAYSAQRNEPAHAFTICVRGCKAYFKDRRTDVVYQCVTVAEEQGKILFVLLRPGRFGLLDVRYEELLEGYMRVEHEL